MQQWFYNILIRLASRWGDWIFQVLARGVALGYYLLFPRRVIIGARFYRALFPERSGFHHLWYTLKQFQNFTTVFFYRFRLMQSGRLDYEFEGWQHLRRAQAEKSGGILLMSHMGNWEVAAHLLKRDAGDLKLLLFMGRKQKEAIEALQKESLARSGITIVAVDQNAASPFDLVEGIRVLRAGGFISMTGDRLWREDQRALTVNFLGHSAKLPETPHLLALLAEVPLYLFFVSMSSKGMHRFTMSPPYPVTAAGRAERSHALLRSAQAYADQMEAHVRAHPFEWYHFEPFLKGRWTFEKCH